MEKNLPYINLDKISNLKIRAEISYMLNRFETALGMLDRAMLEIQNLKNEIAELKGEQGRPNFPSRGKRDISSEKHRNKGKDNGGKDTGGDNDKSERESKSKRNSTSRKKRIENKQIKIDDYVFCELDKAKLPSDIVNKGYESIISQNIIFSSNNIEYRREKFYSPSENKTYIAKLPKEYTGYIHNNLKTFCHIFHHSWDITRSKLISGLSSIGIYLSPGTLNNILKEPLDIVTQQKIDILEAGLKGNYIQIDGTSSRFFGMNYTTQIICSPYFTVYSTLASKNRLHVLYALQGTPKDGLLYCYNEDAVKFLDWFKISKADQAVLENRFTSGQILSEIEFQRIMLDEYPALYAKSNIFKRIQEAFAFGYYFTQTDFPRIKYLVVDDAPEYKRLALDLMLCWVHDARYYNKLSPHLENHKIILENFKRKYWDFYNRLQEFRETPSEERKAELESNFDELFAEDTGYTDLNQEIKRTQKNKEWLLTVLKNHLLPLHNNLAELKARVKVRKRDISLHTMSETGTLIQDAMMSIIQTAQQLGVDSWKYIEGLLYGEIQVSLADLIYEKQCNSS